MKSTAYNLLCFCVVVLVMLSACQTTEQVAQQTVVDSPLATVFDTSKVFESNLTGFALYDPQKDSLLYGLNQDRYFTPASNIKLLTFYTGLQLLPDSIRALEYVIKGDSLVFWGTGDPSFLHSEIGNKKVFNFLKNSDKQLFYSDSNFNDELRGPGWSWSGYRYEYQTEKTPLPMYGNTATFTMQSIELHQLAKAADGSLSVSPPFFRQYIRQKVNENEGGPVLTREIDATQFSYKPLADTSTYEVSKPYHYTPQLVVDMLSDTLEKQVSHVNIQKPDSTRVLYSIPTDTAYKHMLQDSDNFIAEQLLLVAASEMGKPLNSEIVINKIKQDYLTFLADEPQWVDGSGLSRYNMVTPRSMVQLLEQIDEEFRDQQELFNLLAAGGKSGTIKNWYGPENGEAPYVFAKTGTLSNNHSLSGYIITESGRKLTFSFMNNHYVSSSSVVKREMQKVLRFIYQTF